MKTIAGNANTTENWAILPATRLIQKYDSGEIARPTIPRCMENAKLTRRHINGADMPTNSHILSIVETYLEEKEINSLILLSKLPSTINGIIAIKAVA